MRPILCVVTALLFLAAWCAAAPMNNAAIPAVAGVEASLRAELEVHGERILGRDAYHWSTRLAGIHDCRAEFSVRVANTVNETTIAIETVSFSLGALDAYGIEMQQNHWLQLRCLNGDKCVSSAATCSRKTKEGLVVDCTTASQKRADGFSLQFDGDSAAAQRMAQALRQAVDACREPVAVAF